MKKKRKPKLNPQLQHKPLSRRKNWWSLPTLVTVLTIVQLVGNIGTQYSSAPTHVVAAYRQIVPQERPVTFEELEAFRVAAKW